MKISFSVQWPTQEMLDDYWKRSMDAHKDREGHPECVFQRLINQDPSNRYKAFGLVCGCRKCSAHS